MKVVVNTVFDGGLLLLDTEWNNLIDFWHSNLRHIVEKLVVEARNQLMPHLLRTGRTSFSVSLKADLEFKHPPEVDNDT